MTTEEHKIYDIHCYCMKDTAQDMSPSQHLPTSYGNTQVIHDS